MNAFGLRTLAAVVFACGLASAQGADMREQLEKKMDDISQLMRDSEKRLLELANVDRIVEQQEEIVRRLEDLIPPQPPSDAEAARKLQEDKQELEKEQQEIGRRLQELVQGQEQAAQMTVKQLMELLQSLPRQQNQSGRKGEDRSRRKRKDDRSKRLREREDEPEQRQPDSPRRKDEVREEKKKRAGAKRPDEDTERAARMRRVEAWIARLPPEDVARINRNDFSHIPVRYRRLVQEYTALRARREAEKDE